MSNFLSDAEAAYKDTQGGGQSGGQNNFMGDAENAIGGGGNSGNNQSGGGGLMGDAEQMMGGGSGQGGQQGGSSSGGGVMGDLKQGGEDQMVNSEVNGFLTKEGVPSSMDNTVDKYADQEANKFM